MNLQWNYTYIDLNSGFLFFLRDQNVTSSPQYSTFLEHIIPRFLTFLQDGEVQFLQEKPAQVICSREECPAVGVPALVDENNSKHLGLPLKMREVLSDKGHFAHGHCLLR